MSYNLLLVYLAVYSSMTTLITIICAPLWSLIQLFVPLCGETSFNPFSIVLNMPQTPGFSGDP